MWLDDYLRQILSGIIYRQTLVILYSMKQYIVTCYEILLYQFKVGETLFDFERNRDS